MVQEARFTNRWRALFSRRSNTTLLRPELRESLEAESRRRIVQAARSLKEGEIKGADNHLAWVEKADRILVATAPPATRPLLWAAFMALLCVTVAASLLWLKRTNLGM